MATETSPDDVADALDTRFDAWRQGTLDRLSFELTYARDDSRLIIPMGISGAALPNAYNPDETASGAWDQDTIADCNTERALVAEAFNAAVGEAVHEALEWFKLDGAPLLDPHDPGVEGDVHAAVRQLTDALLFLAERRTLRLSDVELATSEPFVDEVVTRFDVLLSGEGIGLHDPAAIAERHGMRAVVERGRLYVRHPKGDALLPLLAAFKDAGFEGHRRLAHRGEVVAWSDEEGDGTWA